jgi:hypothetical protein
MTWGYWGIIGGLLMLLGAFFACMEIIYARARNGAEGNKGISGDSPAGSSKDTKHAA